MSEVLLGVPTGGKHLSIALPGERQEELGGVSGSENGE